jgi:hypothetical protein
MDRLRLVLFIAIAPLLFLWCYVASWDINTPYSPFGQQVICRINDDDTAFEFEISNLNFFGWNKDGKLVGNQHELNLNLGTLRRTSPDQNNWYSNSNGTNKFTIVKQFDMRRYKELDAGIRFHMGRHLWTEVPNSNLLVGRSLPRDIAAVKLNPGEQFSLYKFADDQLVTLDSWFVPLTFHQHFFFHTNELFGYLSMDVTGSLQVVERAMADGSIVNSSPLPIEMSSCSSATVAYPFVVGYTGAVSNPIFNLETKALTQSPPSSNLVEFDPLTNTAFFQQHGQRMMLLQVDMATSQVTSSTPIPWDFNRIVRFNHDPDSYLVFYSGSFEVEKRSFSKGLDVPPDRVYKPLQWHRPALISVSVASLLWLVVWCYRTPKLTRHVTLENAVMIGIVCLALCARTKLCGFTNDPSRWEFGVIQGVSLGIIVCICYWAVFGSINWIVGIAAVVGYIAVSILIASLFFGVRSQVQMLILGSHAGSALLLYILFGFAKKISNFKLRRQKLDAASGTDVNRHVARKSIISIRDVLVTTTALACLFAVLARMQLQKFYPVSTMFNVPTVLLVTMMLASTWLATRQRSKLIYRILALVIIALAFSGVHTGFSMWSIARNKLLLMDYFINLASPLFGLGVFVFIVLNDHHRSADKRPSSSVDAV